MATVFRATRLLDGREVALKVLTPHLAAIIGHDRFRREIAILSTLDHPAILPLLDSGERGGLLFFAMPFVKGETLRDRLNREPQLPIEDALKITQAILAALDYAHGQNVIHRDIKPENILLEDGRALVADFGIARAIVRSGGDGLSTTGLTIGTPTYMSPEQGAGEPRLDGRTDLYSTGCVLYEMLGGGPPFSGPTPQAIQARHRHEAPPPLRIVRPAVSEALQAVLEKSLAKIAADRFRSASEFSDALGQAVATGAVPRRVRSRWQFAVGIAFAVAALVVGAITLTRQRGPKVDPERYVVMPFRHRGSDPHGPVSADNSTHLVWQSLSELRGLALVDEDLVEDRMRRVGGAALSLSGGMEMARDLGAGLVIWGDVSELGDSIALRASVFSVGDKVQDPVRRGDVKVSRSVATERGGSAGELIRKFRELARSLVLPSSEGLGDSTALVGTNSYGALRATLSGDSALLRWNLDLARQSYRDAFTIDPNYAAPRLRFARASLWADAPVSEWGPAAAAALATTRQLAPFEQLEAEGLVALGRGDFPHACGQFREILKRDSLRFTGWYGLGECLTRDSIVLRDKASPSGWRYRGSYSSGIAAFRRALTLVPLAHAAFGGAALSRLSLKLMAQPNVVRIGAALADSMRRFAGYPEVIGDSVAFVPYPSEEVTKNPRVVESQGEALALNRRTLLRITSEWLARYPTSVFAMSANAQALELSGAITSASELEPSALTLVRQLRTAQGHVGLDVQLAAWEVRLRLKARQFTSARLVAESALAVPPKTEADGVTLAALAALTGQVHRAAELYGQFAPRSFGTPDGRFVECPRTVAVIANRLLVYAAFGGPADSIRALDKRLHEEVERWIDSGRRVGVLEAAMFQPRLLAFPLLPPPSNQQLPTARAERAMALGDIQMARHEFEVLRGLRRFQLPGNVALDHALLEARLLAALGDTTAARAQLLPFFDNPAGLGTDVSDLVTQAAAVGRVMALSRQLGVVTRATETDSALDALWKHADGSLALRRRP